jgi:hypothetical protein
MMAEPRNARDGAKGRAWRELRSAALAWGSGIDDETGDGRSGVDMEALDGRLFDAAREYARVFGGAR